MDATKMPAYLLEPALVNEDDVPSQPGENSGTDWEDENASNSSDSDEDENYRTMARHGDHWDTVFFMNPWADEWTADWVNNWVQWNEKSLTNEELYKNVTTQQWMKAFASMRRHCISPLTKPRGPDRCTIPLFQDGNGWQYQVKLIISDIPLPTIRCPSVLEDNQLCSLSLFTLERHIQVEPNPTAEDAPTPPKLAVPLGMLVIRSDARTNGSPPPYATEDTDYFVVVDVEHEDMPLWLLAPRPQLQKRLNNKSYPFEPLKNLPMFDGLLQKEGDCGYDCACILPSLHRLGKPPPDPDAPSFQDTCELIRKTRAVVDPAALLLPRERVRDFIGDERLYDSFEPVPYSELVFQEEGAKSKDETKNEEEVEGGEKKAQPNLEK